MTNLEKLQLFIEHAPLSDGVSPPFIGASGPDWLICGECVRRIQRRGCRLPEPVTLIWPEEGVLIDCCLKDFHEDHH